MMSGPGQEGGTENHRPTQSQLSMRDRLQLAACLNDYTESLCPQQIIAVRKKNSYLKRFFYTGEHAFYSMFLGFIDTKLYFI